MKKSLVVPAIFLLILIIPVMQLFTCGRYHNDQPTTLDRDKYNNAYTIGYENAKRIFQASGYEDGYNNAKEEYQAKINRLASDYEAKINKLASDYEVKVEDSYKTGFTEGEVSMRDRITTEIEINAENKARQGDWNAILFSPKKR